MDDRVEPDITAELVERARAGDNDAIRQFVERSRPRLEALAYLRLGRRLRRHVEVEDVVQETYLRVARLLPRFEYRSVQATICWLETLCEHVVQDFARHLRRQPWRRERAAGKGRPTDSSGDAAVRLLDLVPAPMPSPSRSLRQIERFERLETALDGLTQEQREVLILARVHALPIQQIAARMDRSEGAVGMLLTRAARRLRASFGTTESWHLPADRLAGLLPGTDATAAGGNGDDCQDPPDSPKGPKRPKGDGGRER
jgi:RNA polymerase sigma-70 factor (ECF subfamily)